MPKATLIGVLGVLGALAWSALLLGCQVHASGSARFNGSLDAHGSANADAQSERAPSKPLLALDIDFEFDRATLLASDRKTLADNMSAICSLVQEHKRLAIEGHADSRGPADHNLALSQGRAEAVRQAILANTRCPIAAAQLVAVGYGEKEPRRCHEPAECDGNDQGPKSCEDCWNDNRMTIISLPQDTAARAPRPAGPTGPSGCSRVLIMGEERGSRMCERGKGS